MLKHELIHELSLSAQWKTVNVNIGYTDRRNAILFCYEQMEDNPAATKQTYENVKSLKRLSANITFSPKIGLWSPSFYAGINKQWFTQNIAMGGFQMNTPVLLCQFNNLYELPHNWILSVAMNYKSKGDEDNLMLTKVLFTMNASVSKSLLNNQLTLKLGCSDIFRGRIYGNSLYSGQVRMPEVSSSDSREVYLTVRYKFNTTRSKYKGTGAGSAEKNRL